MQKNKKKDLRAFINYLEKSAPNEIAYVDKQVNSRYEATAVLRKLEMDEKLPMVVFNNVLAPNGEKSETPLLFNAFATRRKLAMALGMAPDEEKMELPTKLAEVYQKTYEPEVVQDAPVQEVVEKDDEVDILKYPAPIHHSKDGGPYILGGSMITKDPDTGNYNVAMIRFHLKGPNQAVVHAEPHHHSGMIVKKYRDRGQSAPFAIVIGHHPSFYLGSQWEGPFGRNEFEIIGAAMQESLRITPSATFGEDLMVPADAEFIVEGLVDPEKIDEEGPIGEHTRYYKHIRNGEIEKSYDPVVKFTAITRRNDAIFQSCWLGHSDQGLIGSIPKEARIYEQAKGVCPGVKAVYMSPAGMCRYLCYISLDQRVGGEAKDAILASFISDWHIKYAIAVDTDVDIFNDKEVLWAVTSRVWAEKDIFYIQGCMGSPLDPTTSIESSKPLVTRMGIDATKPFNEPFSEVCEVDLDILEKIDLEEYIR